MRTRFANAVLFLAVLVCAVCLIVVRVEPDFDFASRAGSSLCKLAGLVTGAVFSVLAARAFEPGTPARRGWAGLAFFQSTWVIGQLYYCYLVIIARTDVPVPSPADVVFICGQLVAFYALFTFISAWHQSGLVTTPSWMRAAGLGAVVLVVATIIGLTMLARVGVLGTADAIVVNIYPALDCALLWPLAILLTMSRGMGGGQLALVWHRMLLGVLVCAVGDFAYAFLAQLGIAVLDPLVDFAFCSAYATMAAAAVQQDAITRARFHR